MKKHLFLMVIASFAVATTVQGQFQLGFKGGFNSTSFNTENAWKILNNQEDYKFKDAKEDIRNGYIFGIYARMKLFGDFSFQPELYYSKKGGANTYRFEGQNTVANESIKEDMEYFSWEIPLLLHLKFLDLEALNLYAVTGPVASFKIEEKSSLYDFNDELISEKSKGATWNYQLGGGIEIWRLNFDVRYEWGINNISISGLKRKGNSLMFSLNFKLF